MSGIILFLVLATWFYIVVKICGWIVNDMRPGNKKAITLIVIFTLLFIAPVGDEIVGWFQFRALCSRGIKPVYNIDKSKGTTVRYWSQPRKNIKNTIIPIEELKISWVDVKTGQPVVEYSEYYATGGWLIRSISYNNVTRPFSFNGVCSPINEITRKFDKLKINKKY